MKKMIAMLLLAVLILLSGCSAPEAQGEVSIADENKTIFVGESPETEESSATASSDESAPVDVVLNVAELFSDRDREGTYEENGAMHITLNGSSVSCDPGAVQVDGNTVTIPDEGTYILSGTLDDGMIIVNAAKEDKVQLVLNGVSIHSETCASIYILQADKVFLTLAENTENTLSNGGTFEQIDENDIDAVIFSKEDLTMNGSGCLTVLSPGGHGIVSKDELTVTSGVYTVSAASHGLTGKDSFCSTTAVMNITAGKDGIHSENNDDASLGYVYIESGEYTISAEGDGISAQACMQIDGGVFDVVSGGGSVNAEQKTSESWGMGGMMPPGGMGGGGMGGGPGGRGGRMMTVTTLLSAGEAATAEDSTSIKGLKCSGDFVINNGVFTIDSADDAIHSNADMTVNGGTFEIKSGDDGFHADNALVIHAGAVHVAESYEGLEGLNIAIHGGEIKLVASDDGINAAGGTDQSGFGGMRGGDMFASNPDSFIHISGGTVDIQASGDGVDSNGSLDITGGFVSICGPTVGDTAVIDYASTGKINGGTLIGTGSSMMAQVVTSEKQGVIPLNVGSQTAGTRITVTDAEGNILLSAEPELNFAIALLSCPEMVKGETYTVTIGSVSGDFAAQ